VVEVSLDKNKNTVAAAFVTDKKYLSDFNSL